MVAPLLGHNRPIGSPGTETSKNTFFRDYVCSHLRSYNAVSVLPLVSVAAKYVCSYDTTRSSWELFACDVIIITSSCGCLILRTPLISLPPKGQLISAWGLRAVIGVIPTYFRYQSGSPIDTLHLFMHVVATSMSFFAQNEPKIRKSKLSKKKRYPLSEYQQFYALCGITLATGLGYLVALLDEVPGTTVLKVSYGFAIAGMGIIALIYQEYQLPAIGEKDVESEEMPESFKRPLETNNPLIPTPVPWLFIPVACGYLLPLQSKRLDTIDVIVNVLCLIIAALSYLIDGGTIDYTSETQPGDTVQIESQVSNDESKPSAGTHTSMQNTSAEVLNPNDTITSAPLEKQDALDASLNAFLEKLHTYLKRQDAYLERQDAYLERQDAHIDSLIALLEKQNAYLERNDAHLASLIALLEKQNARDVPLTAPEMKPHTPVVETETAATETWTTVLDFGSTDAESEYSDIESESTDHDN